MQTNNYPCTYIHTYILLHLSYLETFMDWFGEIIVASVSYPGQQIYVVILDVFWEGVWIPYYVIPRERTAVTQGSFQRYNVILQNSKKNSGYLRSLIQSRLAFNIALVFA